VPYVWGIVLTGSVTLIYRVWTMWERLPAGHINPTTPKFTTVLLLSMCW
jgi:hypothetical protein